MLTGQIIWLYSYVYNHSSVLRGTDRQGGNSSVQRFDESRPIYLQIKERIEEQILSGQLQEEDQIPSTTQLVNFYKINHLTISRGIQLLVEDGIVYKKRGVGMFVAKGAREKLVQRRKDQFAEQYIDPLLWEAENLGISDEELIRLIKWRRKGDGHERHD